MIHDREQSLELLNQTHDFPTKMVFKVIGTNTDGFADRVILCVRETLDLDTAPQHQSRLTPGERHVSISLEPEVQNAEQVLDVYDRLKNVHGVVMLL